MQKPITKSGIGTFLRFLPFWIFLIFFKFGGGLHYSLISPLGEKILPLWIVGILMGGGSIIQLILDVPAGHILDRYGYRKFLKITTFTFLFAAVAYMVGFTQTTYYISLVLSTFGWLFYGPGVNAYILSHAPKEHAAKFISLRDVFGSVGIVLSSVALPFVLLLSPQYMGYFLFTILSIAFVAIAASPKDRASVHTEKKIPTHHHYIRRSPFLSTVRSVKKLNPASGMLLLSSLSAALFYGIIWFTVPLVIAHEANTGLLSVGLGVFDLSVVILGFLLGKLADKFNKRTLVFFGLLLFSLSGMILGFSFSWLFIVFGFLATSGDEMSGISLWSWLHSLDREHAGDGIVAGVINLFEDLGWAIGPIVAGVLYDLVGPSLTITLGALPIFFTWGIYYFTMKEHFGGLSLANIPAKPHRPRHRT